MDPPAHHESFEERRNELLRELAKRPTRKQVDERPAVGEHYQFRLGRRPISLTLLEYRIIQFLAEHPYHAFTPAQIVAQVGTEQHPLDEAGLDAQIQSLRGKLGLFSDYIQSVPYIGYRFKP